MKRLPTLFVAVLCATTIAAAAAPSVEVLAGPIVHPDHAEVEILSKGRSGVRVTAADGALIWHQWLDRGQDVSLTVNPMGSGNPGEVVYHGEEDGRDRLTFWVTWPGECPCVVEVTSGDAVAFGWSEIVP